MLFKPPVLQDIKKSPYPPVSTGAVFKEYWKSSKPYSFLAILSVVGLVINVLAQSIIAPIYYKHFFDTLVAWSVAGNGLSGAVPLLTHIIFIVLGLNFLGWLGYRLYAFATTHFQIKVMRDIRQQSFDYLLGHSLAFFTNNFSGSLVQKVNRYARSFERMSDRIFSDILSLILKVVGATVVLFLLAPMLAWALLVWVALFIVVTYFFSKYKLKYDVQAAAADSRVSAVMSDSIANHNAIQLFTGVAEESKIFREANTYLADLTTFRWNLGYTIDAVQAFLNIGIEFFVFFFAIHYWQYGLVTIGTFTLIQAYLLGIGGNLWSFGRVIRDVYESLADAKEMVEILHHPHSVQDMPNASTLQVKKGAVDFKHVSFSFNKNRQVIKDLSISIKAGEKVALIGPSGAGKSTVVKLLMRLYDVGGGEIVIDGQNIAQVTQESLREHVSLVPQDPALFHRSLMENIRYGRRDATDEEVFAAARSAHCDEFIRALPHTYDTLVGERGVKLSGGERQRVAIARAIIKNAPILILDEATSSLDSHSEFLIQDALENLMKNKTTIVIAHRLSTIRKMDRIIVIGAGGVIEEGSHDELLKKEGSLYARLWSLQAGGFADKSIEEMLTEWA